MQFVFTNKVFVSRSETGLAISNIEIVVVTDSTFTLYLKLYYVYVLFSFTHSSMVSDKHKYHKKLTQRESNPIKRQSLTSLHAKRTPLCRFGGWELSMWKLVVDSLSLHSSPLQLFNGKLIVGVS